jgi:hypothetical protein
MTTAPTLPAKIKNKIIKKYSIIFRQMNQANKPPTLTLNRDMKMFCLQLVKMLANLFRNFNYA